MSKNQMKPSGHLILSRDNGPNVTYEPVDNVLHVGSEKAANVSLSDLKSVAFTISIDNSGRVSVFI